MAALASRKTLAELVLDVVPWNVLPAGPDPIAKATFMPKQPGLVTMPVAMLLVLRACSCHGIPPSYGAPSMLLPWHPPPVMVPRACSCPDVALVTTSHISPPFAPIDIVMMPWPYHHLTPIVP